MPHTLHLSGSYIDDGLLGVGAGIDHVIIRLKEGALLDSLIYNTDETQGLVS